MSAEIKAKRDGGHSVSVSRVASYIKLLQHLKAAITLDEPRSRCKEKNEGKKAHRTFVIHFSSGSIFRGVYSS